MEDYTASYERLLSSQGGGGGITPSYRHPPPRPSPAVFGSDLHNGRIPGVPTSSSTSNAADPVYPGRFMTTGTGSLPFLSTLYGSNGSSSTPSSCPLSSPPSPYRSGNAASGLVNNRTFWPPTPPPEAAYSRCGVGGSYYPMFSSLAPMVSSSDLSSNCGNILSRMSSPSNPFMNLLSSHKDTHFLPLRLSSPVTTHSLSSPPIPYLHFPAPSIDHCYPSTPGLFSPHSLHGIQSGLQDLPKAKHSELDAKPCEKVTKSEPLSLSTSSEKDQTLLSVNNTECCESGKRSKPSSKLLSVKAREKHDAKKDEHKKLHAVCSSQTRKISPTIPVMTAMVLPCNVSSNSSSLKTDSSKCSKYEINVDEMCKKEKLLSEGTKEVDSSRCAMVKSTPVSCVMPASTVATGTVIGSCTDVSSVNSLVSQKSKVNNPETKSPTQSPKLADTASTPPAMKHLPCSQRALKSTQSPLTTVAEPLPKEEQTEDIKQCVLTSSDSDSATTPNMSTSISRPVLATTGESMESHVSTVCSFSSWVHHQTSVTSVIKQDNPETDSCLHAVQSQTTVVNLSMDKGVHEASKTSQTAKSESTLIFQMKNTHNAKQVKCHQTSESTEDLKGKIVNQNQKTSSRCSVKEVNSESSACVKEVSVEKSVCVKNLPKENVPELQSDNQVRETDNPASQPQAINLSLDKSKLSAKECFQLPTTGSQNRVSCDIKKGLEVTNTRSSNSLSTLVKPSSKTISSMPGTTVSSLSNGPNGPWNTTNKKVKPSSIVSSIQSENLQTACANKKTNMDRLPCSSVAASTLKVSATTGVVSSPSTHSVRSDNKDIPTFVKMREVVCNNNTREENKVAKVCNILPNPEIPTNSAVCTSVSNPIINTSVATTIPVGIAVAQLRHDSSTVSIKKAIVKANNIDNRTTIPAIVDKGDQRFLKTSITAAADTTMIVNATPTLNHWDGSGTVVRPATLSGSWLAPAPSVVTPTVWLGPTYQSATTQPTPCIGQPIGSLVEATPAPTTNAIVPPVGYHLARDPMTGHLFLIPAPSIDILDRSNVWPTYSPNSVQQVISHFPAAINGTKKELKPILTMPQILEKPEVPVIQTRLLQPTDQTLTQEIKDIKGLNTAVQSSVTSITVQTGQPFAFPSFTAAPQPTVSYFYDQPTIVHLAQTQTATPTLPTVAPVQTELGKRSQGTSPLNSVTPSPPPQPCAQVSECESDAESLLGSETCNKLSVGVAASCQVDMDACSNNSNDMEYEERRVEVFDSANQTDNILLDSMKDELEDASPASLVVREDNEDGGEKLLEPEVATDVISQENEEKEESEVQEPNLNNNIGFEAEEEEMTTPILPTESKPVIDFIDQHGLNLLVDSIEEFASREQNLPSTETSFKTELKSGNETELFDSASKSQLDSYGIEASCTDGLGLLCALAEQRFLEETKNYQELEKTKLSRARSCSPDMPCQPEENESCHQERGVDNSVRSGSLSNSRCQSPVLLNPAELEMRYKLAELQRKYKIKQKELAKLKAKREKDILLGNATAEIHMPLSLDCLDDSPRKKKNKCQPQSTYLDSFSVKTWTNSDVSKKTFNNTVNSGGLDSGVDEEIETSCLPSPVRVSLPSNTQKQHEELHQVSPVSTGVIRNSDPELPEMFSPNTSGGSICKSKLSSKKKKKKKKKEIKATNNIFQLWKEQKLVELSRITGKPYVCTNKVKVTLAKSKSLLRRSKAQSKKNSASQKTLLTENVEMNSATLKRKLDNITSEGSLEIVNAKHQKLETSQERDEQESTTVNLKDVPIIEPSNEDVKPSPSTQQATKIKKRVKKHCINIDDFWSRRRSERIFLHDAGVTPSSTINSSNNTVGENKSPKNVVEPPKKKMTRKELGLKKLKYHEAEKQNQAPLEMFLSLRQCRLSEMGFLLNGTTGIKNGSSQDDSSGSEGDLPLSQLLQAERRTFYVPELPSCKMQVSDLHDCQRVLMEEDDLYYAGYVTAIQAPDVYGITLDRERGNRPHIFSREEMLEQTVKEVKPIHVKQIPEGSRVCAYWSQQYRCLYPGTVTKDKSTEPVQNKNSVFVEFDDGDSGRIPLEDVRLLLPDPDFQLSDNSANTITDENITNDLPKDTAIGQTNRTGSIANEVESQMNKKCQESAIENSIDADDPEEKPSKPKKSELTKIEKNSKKKKKLGAKDSSKANGKSQTNKVKKVKAKSNKSEKSKIKGEKNKKKLEKNLQTSSVMSLVDNVEKESDSLIPDSAHSSEAQLSNENSSCMKLKKQLNLLKLGKKKVPKLKSSSFLSKKPKATFGDSSVISKIKGLNKLHKNKINGKEKSKVDKVSSDVIKDSCKLADCKVKKHKKHKTEHKHHHHHHKRHCHHHHKKHKKKAELLGMNSPQASNTVLNISVGLDPNEPFVPSEESKLEMPMCCVSPGRSELSVKIKASPPYTSPCLPVKVVENKLPAAGSSNKTKDVESKQSPDETLSTLPKKGTTKSSEKFPPVKADSSSKKETSSGTKSAKKRKERKISCEKSKIAAFLPARQLWRWSGKSFKRRGTKGKAKKLYFKSITRGKETIKVGDCAVFLSTGRPHLPYVGNIETMWQSWRGNTVVKVKWFYHPEETKGGKKLAHPKGALFQSPHMDENDLQTISHKCEVLSWSDYQKWCEKRGSASKSNFENEDVYYLAGNYEPLTKVLTLEPGVS